MQSKMNAVGESTAQGAGFAVGGIAATSVQMVHARQVHVMVTDKHNPSIVRLSLHTHLQNRYTQLLCALWQGTAPNYTMWLGTLDKGKGTSSLRFTDARNSVLIVHAAFLDSGCFCKTKIAKK